MSQLDLFAPAPVDRPCWARWRGTCPDPATCQVALGPRKVAEWFDACTYCADARQAFADAHGLPFDRCGLDVDTNRMEHRWAVRLPSGFVRSFREWFRADQYANRFDGAVLDTAEVSA